jgi:hypothetical protein
MGCRWGANPAVNLVGRAGWQQAFFFLVDLSTIIVRRRTPVNWEMVISALIVAVGLFISARELAKTRAQHTMASTMANMVALLCAARLTDRKYVERIVDLRHTVDRGLETYPGSSERVREIEAEIEIAKEMLREIDFMEPSAREPWIELASNIYREAAQELAS